jgi:mRNA-degrading endonuclease RelE of RelBE toxin-antitoxin system
MPEKKWRVELSKAALKHLKSFSVNNSQKILITLEDLEKSDYPPLHRSVRPLSGKLKGFYRLRISEFRIIFELETGNKRIGVHSIVHRGSAY